MTLVNEDKTCIISFLREADNSTLQSLLDWFANPTKERGYSDLSGKLEHLYTIKQADEWIHTKDIPFITVSIRNQLKEIKEEMVKQNATYFRLINQPT